MEGTHLETHLLTREFAMRQVFLQKPWIYHEEPKEIRDVFFKYGTLERLKRGTAVMNGGEGGRFYYLKKGLGIFSFEDKNGRSFIFNLVLPGRVFADVDGVSREIVNVVDLVIRPSEVLSIDYDAWHKHIGSNPELLLMVTKGIISKHESHMEAMIANYTLSIEERLKVFLKVLLMSYIKEITSGWHGVPLYLSTGEYASLIGSSRVSVSRIFTVWNKKGLLRKEGREIVIHSDLFDDIYDWTEV